MPKRDLNTSCFELDTSEENAERSSVTQIQKNKQKIIHTLKSVTLTPIGGVWNWQETSLTWSCTKLKITRNWNQPINILIDFGMHQWWEEERTIELNKEIPFNPSKIDATILTHAHVDHIWKIPMLVNQEWKEFFWPLYATKVTSLLSFLILEDSAKIMEEEYNSTNERASKLKKTLRNQLTKLKELQEILDNSFHKKSNSRQNKLKKVKNEYWNDRNKMKKKLEEIKPILDSHWVESAGDIANIMESEIKKAEDKVLFSKNDVNKVLSHLVQTSLYERKEIFPGVYLRFFEAAHIMWSWQVILEIDKWDWSMFTMWFSWDVGRFFQPWYLWKPDIPDVPFDFYQIESTYWDRLHKPREAEHQIMWEKINQIYQRGWKIVIPCFMVQRLQDVAVFLIKMMEEWQIPKMNIYYDGAYVENINNIFRFSNNENYKKLWNKILKPVEDSNKSNKFIKSKKACILLSPSGMMNWGSIQKYIKPILSKSKNALFFVWYQAKWTHGRKIQEWTKKIKIKELWDVQINSQVESFGSFSAHWDKDDLMYLISELDMKKDSNVLVNHWEKWHWQDELVKSLQKANFESSTASKIWQTYKIY